MTFRQKQQMYRERLAELPLTGSERHAFAVRYSGHGSIPRHCPDCGQLWSEAHACATPPCAECGADVVNDPHAVTCSYSDDPEPHAAWEPCDEYFN